MNSLSQFASVIDTGGSSPVRHIEMFTKQNKENRPINQSGGTKKILKKPYRHMGKDTTLRHKLGFETPHTKNSYALSDLPREIHFRLALYLSPFEIHTKLKPLNRHFHDLCRSTLLWNYFNRARPLNLLEKYVRVACLVERRSKGKLFQAVSLLNGQTYTQRIVDVMVANANCDDGLPPSLTREISYLRSIQPHENVNKLVDVEVYKNTTVCLIFEYQPFTLKDLLKAKQTQPKFCYEMVRQIARGMHQLHSQGLMHRNLKPENVLITQDHQIKISDFNLSRLVQGSIVPYTPEDPKDRERSGRESKRLWYRAPELLMRKTLYAHEIDVWSFGCLMAEIALGEPLFNGDSEISQLFQTFQMLGSPTEDDWVALNLETEKIIKFPQWKQHSLNQRRIVDQAVYHADMKNRQSAYQKIKRLNQVLGDEGMDLLDQLLQIRPSRRPSFHQIMQHPWINPLGKPQAPLVIHPPTPQFKNYIPTFQPNITPIMRAILVDWLIDVATHFDLSQETLHLAVIYTDLTLGRHSIEKKILQLIGVTSMKMADVYYERSREYYKQENCQEYSYITADEYTVTQLIATEKEILKHLNFQLTYTTTPHLVKRYGKQITLHPKLWKCAEFFCDLFLQMYDTIEFSYELLAWSYIFLATTVADEVNPYTTTTQILVKVEDLTKCTQTLRSLWLKWKNDPQTNAFDAVHQKYASLQTRSFNIQFSPNDIDKFYKGVSNNSH